MASILVVDDDRDLVALVRMVLAREGHAVQVAASVGDAERRLATARPDLVVLDASMEDFGGISLLGSLRENPLLSDVPVIMLAISRDAEELVEGAGGITLFFGKPFEVEDLAAAVADLVERAEGPTGATQPV